MRLSAKAGLPILVLLLGGLGAVGLIAIKPGVSTRAPSISLPVVRVIRARAQPITLTVRAQGTVFPRTESELVAEVSGRIIRVSPSLASGGFFEAGDPLVEIEPSDYELVVERAAAQLARAESELELARSQRLRRETLAERGVGSAADVDAVRSAAKVAEAARRDAVAALKQARRDLSRTRVLAPFAGRVREKRVDVGQFVSRGAPVARVYAVDYAEVRLPIPDDEVAFVDLPIDYRNEFSDSAAPEVKLRARFAGREYTWTGRIVRTEGELDPSTRMIYAVARVEDPYGRGSEPDRPPLAVGLFVEAEIVGRKVDDVVILPARALRGSDRVIIVDDEDRLRTRRVEVLRRERNTVLIRSGISDGERICTSPLPASGEGLRVRIAESQEGALGDRRTAERGGS